MEPSPKYLIGIDEVGRGPIAGPVAVGAFVFLTPEAKKFFRGVKESKQLTEEKREKWFEKILKIKEQGHVDFCVTFESEKTIDEKGIVFAIKTCLYKSLHTVAKTPEECEVRLDGGLKAPKHFKLQKTIIRGDAKEQVIALASICAKVLRDRHMKELAKIYPGYDFDVHKGYGTRGHYNLVKKLGLSELHRKSFCKSLISLAKKAPLS
jgi:ribonuclease HII